MIAGFMNCSRQRALAVIWRSAADMDLISLTRKITDHFAGTPFDLEGLAG
jgi:hypothetical protein